MYWFNEFNPLTNRSPGYWEQGERGNTQRMHIKDFSTFQIVISHASTWTETDPGLWNCHHHGLERPRSPQFHLPKSQQKLLLNVSELILDSGAVTVVVWSAPGHHTSVSYYRSKSSVCVTDLLNVPELTLDSEAVTAKVSIAPLPSPTIAAKAAYVSQTCWTFLSWPWIRKLSLPKCRLPHFRLLLSQQKQRMCHRPAERSWADLGFGSCHCQSVDCPTSISYYRSKSSECAANLLNLTELILDSGAVARTPWSAPSLPSHHKVNDSPVVAIFGCCATAAMVSLSWSSESRREFAGSKRNGCPKDCRAAIFKSAVVPECESATVSPRPLGKETRLAYSPWHHLKKVEARSFCGPTSICFWLSWQLIAGTSLLSSHHFPPQLMRAKITMSLFGHVMRTSARSTIWKAPWASILWFIAAPKKIEQSNASKIVSRGLLYLIVSL